MRRPPALALAVLVLPLIVAPGAAAAPAPLRAARAPAGQLERVRVIRLPGGATIRQYRQEVRGVPVLGGGAVVNDAPGAAPELATESTRAAIEPPATPRVSRRAAIVAATGEVSPASLLAQRSASLAIAPGDGGTLVWRVEVPSARPLGDFEVLVDAGSGTVLESRNLIRDYRTGHAKLYDPNPVVEHGGWSGLKSDHHDRNTPLLTSLRRRVALHDIRRGQHCLRGRFAHALRGNGRKETCARRLRFTRIKRANGKFEALMAYYHVDRAQRYLRALGFKGSSAIDDRRQPVIVNPFTGDNSFYLPSDRKIRYGSGGVDDAEDADVILHEYGHAMQDDQSPTFLFGHSLQAASLAEGSGDYWAAAMSALSPGTTNTDDVCIFDWDGTVWGDPFPLDKRFCGRRADNPSTLSQEMANPVDCSSSDGQDEHCVGTVWSSALWTLRGELGDDASGHSIMDRVYLTAQFMYTSSENFSKAANDLLCADDDLYPQGTAGDCKGDHWAQIKSEMTARGF